MTADGQKPRDDAPAIPGEWGVDADSFTDEDGLGDNQDGPLPEIEAGE